MEVVNAEAALNANWASEYGTFGSWDLHVNVIGGNHSFTVYMH